MTKSEAKRQIRTERFEALRKAMEAKGYREDVRTISVLKASIAGVLTVLPIVAVCCAVYSMKWGWSVFDFGLKTGVFIILAALVCVIIHEGLHGLAWGMFCEQKMKSIQFDVLWSSLTPYCTCAESLSTGKYIFGALTPLVALGFGLYFPALLSGSISLLAISFINILSACGDVLISLMALRHRASVIIDHPTGVGFVAYSK